MNAFSANRRRPALALISARLLSPLAAALLGAAMIMPGQVLGQSDHAGQQAAAVSRPAASEESLASQQPGASPAADSDPSAPDPTALAPTGLDLTPAERDWLAAHPRLSAAVMDAWPPLDFRGPSGEAVGVGVDLLRLLGERLGIVFRIEAAPFKDSLGALKEGRLDVLMDITPRPEREAFVNFTQPYLTIPHVIVGRVDGPYFATEAQLAERTLAIERGFFSVDYFRDKYPGIRVDEYPDTDACLEAVSRGDADAYVGNRAVATYLIARRLLTNLRVMGRIERSGSVLAIGVRKDWPLLAAILDKALTALDPVDKQRILARWTGQGEELPQVRLTDAERAWITANPKVRVAATPDWPPFEYMDANGRFAGISADVFRVVARRLGLEPEFVVAPWAELLARLKRGELDVGPGLIPTPSRAAYLDFSEPFFSSFIGIWTTEDNDRIASGGDLAGQRVAVVDGYYNQDVLAAHFPAAEPLVMSSPLEALKAVSTGRADAYMGAEVVVNFLVDRYLLRNLRLVDYLEQPRLDLVIGVPKDRPHLAGILNKALGSISEQDMAHIRELYVGRGKDFQARFALSEEERAWLARHPRWRLGIDPAWLPLEAAADDGEPLGIISEYTAWLAEILGAELAPVPVADAGERARLLATGELDLVASLTADGAERAALASDLPLTSPYLRLPLVLVAREEAPFAAGLADMNERRIAIPAGQVPADVLRRAYPGIHIQPYPDLHQALLAVARGEADAALGNAPEVTHQIRAHGLDGLRVMATTNHELSMVFAARPDWPALAPLIDRALTTLSKEQRQSFRDRWVNVGLHSRLDWKRYWRIALVAALIGGSLLLVILVWNRRLAAEVAERKRAERELRKLSRVVEQSPSAVLITDTQGCIEYVNPAFCAVTGYSAEEVFGRNPRILNSGEQDAAVFHALWKCILGGGVWRGELANKRKDGRLFWEQAAISPIFNEQGVPTHFFAVKEDITERKRAESELAASEARFRGLFEAATIPLAEVHESGEILAFNPIFTQTFGWSLAEIPDLEHWWPRVFPDPSYRERVKQDWALIAQSLRVGEQQLAPWEYRMTCADGQHKQVLISQRAFGESKVVSFVDVTDMRRYEQALRDQLRLQEALIDTIPNPIFIKDAEARFIGCNRAYEQAFATTREFMRGKTVLELPYLPEASRAAYQAEDTQVIAEGSLRHHELCIPFADGCEHDVLYWVAGFTLSDGRRGGLIGIIVDISALKEAQRLAEEATRAKSEFLATMSHEMRTPMTAVLGMAQLALTTELSDQQRDYLGKLESAGKSLLRLIDDVLDYAKIEAGRLAIAPREFPFDQLLEQLSDHQGAALARRADAKGLELLYRIAPEMPAVLVGDPVHLGRVLGHLMDNAIKFTEQGEITLSVARIPAEGEDEGVVLRFAVSDTGIGLSESQREQLFQPFSQLDGSMTRQHGGAGLGLASCQRLVALMDGEIGVDSQPGEGSTFWFSVRLGQGRGQGQTPSQNQDQDQDQEHERAQGQGQDGPPGVSPWRLPAEVRAYRALIFSARPSLAEVLGEMLDAMGLLAGSASSGSDALATLRRAADLARPFDLLLCDWPPPDMTEDALLHALAELPEPVRPKLVALARPRDHQRLRDRREALGLAAVLAKPARPKVLADTLLAIETQARPRSLATPAVTLPPLPGFDTAAAIARLAGETPVYHNLLLRFERDQRETPARLRALIDSGDLDGAERSAHALKGAAASLGHATLTQAASVLEDCLRRRAEKGAETETAAAVERVEQALAAALDALQALPPAPEVTATRMTPAADSGALRALLEALQPDVRARRATRCREALKTIAAADWPAPLQSEATELAGQLRGYRFEQAGKTLARMLGKMRDGADEPPSGKAGQETGATP